MTLIATGVAAIVPTAHCGFMPDPLRGEALDREVRSRLAESLGSLVQAADNQLAIDAVAMEALIAALGDHRVGPVVMALYSELVTAVFNDDADRAERVFGALAKPGLRHEPRGLRSVTLDGTTLEGGALDPLVLESYVKQFIDDGELLLELAPLTPAELSAAAARFDAGRTLLTASHPALSAEIESLICEVIFVNPKGVSDDLTLHGASSFFVWGALMVNPAPHPDRLTMAEVLVHESAHSLLHGLTLGQPLVENPDTERYPSPLRYDPRPMEGLVHASYVLARMHLGMAAMRESGQLNEAEQTEAGVRLTRIRQNFEDGHAVVRAHARFTPRGAEIFAGAAAYMAA